MGPSGTVRRDWAASYATGIQGQGIRADVDGGGVRICGGACGEYGFGEG